jgi:hypothetical protein
VANAQGGDPFLSRGFSVHQTGLRQGLDRWQFMHQAVVAFIDKTAAPILLGTARGLRAYRLTPAHGEHSQPPLLAIPPTTRCSIWLVGSP